MTPEDQYPSTFDCPPIVGAQDDSTLMCIENSRERVRANHTRNAYVDTVTSGTTKRPAVCAVGAVLAEDGLSSLPMASGAELMAMIEADLSAEAKEAIDLLNEAALELHPEAEYYRGWSGPLEWVNQDWKEDEDLTARERERIIKAEVLRIYDHAIAKRKGELVTA